MQSDAERTPTLKANSEEQTPCSCNACYPRKDFGSPECITVPHPRDIYNHQRLVGFGSHIPIVPYGPVEYPGSPARFYRAPFNLHRPGYPRAMFSPAGPESRIYDLPRMQDMSKHSGPHENQLVQSQALQLQPNSATSGRVWEQASGSGPREKPRRMRTVFTPEQLERLERHFKCQQYVGSAQRIYIAKQLGLSETQVKVWFQNRRIRWRKQVLGAAVKSQS